MTQQVGDSPAEDLAVRSVPSDRGHRCMWCRNLMDDYYGPDNAPVCVECIGRLRPRAGETGGPGDQWRALAEWCDTHPEYASRIARTDLYIFVDDRADFVRAARELGPVQKDFGTKFAYLRFKIGTIPVSVCVEREMVCHKTTRLVRVTRPRVIETNELEEVIEEVVDWHCPESILAPDQQ